MTQPNSIPQNPSLAQPESAPLLTIRAAIILLAAAVIGMVAGGLTCLSARSVAGAVLAGLTASGASVLGLHQLIGRSGS